MASKKNKLIFIVEDNEMYSIMLDYTLSNDSTLKFMCFKTGEECLENLHFNPMMIILDYWLPGINGLETFKKVRQKNKSVPIIILTQDHDVEIATLLLNAGVNDYFNKGANSVFEIKQLINNEFSKLIEKEEIQSLRMKIVFFVFCIVAVAIVLIYAKRFW